MTRKLHDFLVEHAIFSFPQPNEDHTSDTTDISQFQVGMFEIEWRAGYAVRDACSETLPDFRRHPWGHPFSDWS